MMDQLITCKKCGSKYNLIATKVPYRDNDRLYCKKCGEIVYEWNYSYTYRIEPVEE